MEIYKMKDYEDVSKKAASFIIKDLILKPNLILGLATGSSPLGLYRNLIEAYEDDIISFKDVMTFNLDEYIGIPRDHPQSYFSFMHEHLFRHIDIDEANINIPNNDLDQLDKLAMEYDERLFGHQRDIQILGIGSNGHIGFNEPGTPLGNETFVVELNDQTRRDNARFFGSFDDVPKYAITMGIKNIMYSKKIVLIASGKHKAEAVYKMVYGDIDKQVPASILQLHPDCRVVVDEAAASLLRMDGNYKNF